MKNWLNKKTIEKEIDGEVIKFRRASVGVLQKFRVLNAGVARGLSLAMKDTSHDVDIDQMSTPSDVVDAAGNPVMNSGYKQSAAQPSTIQIRRTQLEEGIKSIIEVLTKEESLDILSEIIVNSAYEEFADWDKDDIPKLKDQMDLVTMIEFLKGAFEASAGDYVALGKSLFQKNPKLKVILDNAMGK